MEPRYLPEDTPSFDRVIITSLSLSPRTNIGRLDTAAWWALGHNCGKCIGLLKVPWESAKYSMCVLLTLDYEIWFANDVWFTWWKTNTEQAPSYFTGVVFFGPFVIRQGRTNVKLYSCIFACLASRAVHSEVAHELIVHSFTNAFLRFSSRRGKVGTSYSNNRTKSFGLAELRFSLIEWKQDVLQRQPRQRSLRWQVNPLLACHVRDAQYDLLRIFLFPNFTREKGWWSNRSRGFWRRWSTFWIQTTHSDRLERWVSGAINPRTTAIFFFKDYRRGQLNPCV